MTTSLGPLASRIAAVKMDAAPNPESGSAKSLGGASFGDVLNESIEKVNNLQQKADEAIQGLATGQSADVAQTMIAVQQASLSFQLMTQVRNKLVQAYEEVMRMPV